MIEIVQQTGARSLSSPISGWIDTYIRTKSPHAYAKLIIRRDGSIDCEGDIRIAAPYTRFPIRRIQVQFNIVYGDFSVMAAGVNTLVGCPKLVSKSFNCAHNKLTTLVGSPIEVGENFECYVTDLQSLYGGPKEVQGTFDADSTDLTTLEHLPRFIGEHLCVRGCRRLNLNTIFDVNTTITKSLLHSCEPTSHLAIPHDCVPTQVLGNVVKTLP